MTNRLPTWPDRWCSATGQDAFEVVTSGSRGWAQHYAERGAKFIRVGNLNHDSISLDLRNVQHVQPPKGAEGQRTKLQGNDLLISITAELGMVAVVPPDLGEAFINQHIALARPRVGWEPRFLAWYLASEADGKRTLKASGRGGTKVGLGLDDIRNAPIPVASLQEQKRIADKLDSVLTRVDAVNARLACVAPILKRFRQSVLASAMTGRLTADWREENGEDNELRSPILASEDAGSWSFSSVPASWAVCPFTSCFSDETDSTRKVPQTEYVTKGELAVVDQGQSLIGGFTNDLSMISACPLPALVFGDHTRVVKWIEFPFAQGADGVKVLRPRLDIPKFACLLLRAITLPDKGYSRHFKYLKRSVFPVPPAEEQAEIVRHVETLFAFADRLEARLQTAQTAADRLTPSLLAKAFRGELVPQDPNDEPASELLKRLAEQGPTSKTKRLVRKVKSK